MVMKLLSALTAAFALLCTSLALADPPAMTGLDPQSAAKDNVEYREIYRFYTLGDYETALKRMTSFERMYPSSKILPSVENLHGMTYLLLKQPAQAVAHFKKAA